MFKQYLVLPTIDKRSLEIYCNIGILHNDLIFAKLRNFVKTKPLRNGDIILSFTESDVGKLGLSHEILMSQICLLNIILTKISGFRVFKHIILKRFLLFKNHKKVNEHNTSQFVHVHLSLVCLDACFPFLIPFPLKYSKTCVKRPLKNRQNKGLKDKW